VSGTKDDKENRWTVVSISFGTPERLSRAKARAKRLDRPLSSYIRMLIEDDLARDESSAIGAAKRSSLSGYPDPVPGLSMMGNEPVSSTGAVGEIYGAVGNVGKDVEAGRADALPAARKPARPSGVESKSKTRPGGPGRAPKKSP
jgi:hypothetical protein